MKIKGVSGISAEMTANAEAAIDRAEAQQDSDCGLSVRVRKREMRRCL
jgi:hypothetical protein